MVFEKAFLLGFVVTILSISACTKPTDNIIPIEEVVEENNNNTVEEVRAFAGVNPELWPYFTRFEDEGLARGLDIDLTAANVTGVIEELDEEHVAGQCTYNSHDPNHLIIDATFWENAPDMAKEFVVFHELGHCNLGRLHREGMNSNGTCVSIMRSGLENCKDNYHTETRPVYLDELFDETFHNEIF